ncbi:MAG: hypothetical protein Tsb0021_05290 [Chlamydiales bacterium]
MKNQDFVKTTRRLFDEVFSNNNIEVLNELVSENVTIHDDAIKDSKKGLTSLKTAEKNYWKAFPDKKATIDSLWTVDDSVIVRWKCTGTHKGMLEDISPTNKKFNINGIAIYKFNNEGKIVEIWQNWDRLTLLEQIGEIRPTHAALHA